MSYRFMRVIVFFDLPILTESNLREYRKFRKFLIKSGFMMVQESVYCKLAQNSSVADIMVDNIKKNNPPDGLVQVLRVTEKQYNKMDFIVGEKTGDVLTTTERLVIL